MAETTDPNAPAVPATPATPPAPVVDQAAFHAAIEKARLEERAKGRAEMDRNAQQALDKEAEAQKARAELAALTLKLDALTKAGGASGVDANKAVDAALSQFSERIQKSHEQQLSEMRNRLDETEKRNEEFRLQALKLRLIQEAGPDTVIEALVKGTNEEELRQSIATAQDTLKRHLTRLGSAASVTPASNATPASNPASPLPNAAPVAGGSASSLLANVKTMSSAEYAKNRDQIKRAALEAARSRNQV